MEKHTRNDTPPRPVEDKQNGANVEGNGQKIALRLPKEC